MRGDVAVQSSTNPESSAAVMKRLLVTLIAAATVAAPLAGSQAYAKDGRGHGGGNGRWEQQQARGPAQGRQGDGRGAWRAEERGPSRGPPARVYREAPPEEGRNYYGPPPGAYAAPRNYGVGRGRYLPPEAAGPVVQDYGRYRLRPPPRGFAWVRVGDAFALVGPDGQIFDMIR